MLRRIQEIQLLELESQTQLLQRIQLVTRFNSNVLYISGPGNSGKSTLAQLYLELWSSAQQQAFVILSSKQTDAQIRATLLSQLLPHAVFNNEDSLLESIQREAKNNKQQQLIVVDNADLLSNELLVELWLLVQYAQQKTDARETWQINLLLFAPLGHFSNRLSQLSAGQSLSITEIEVDPFSTEEQILLNELSVEMKEQLEQKMKENAARAQLEAEALSKSTNNEQPTPPPADQTPSKIKKTSNKNNNIKKPTFLSAAHLRTILLISAAVISVLLILTSNNKEINSEQLEIQEKIRNEQLAQQALLTTAINKQKMASEISTISPVIPLISEGTTLSQAGQAIQKVEEVNKLKNSQIISESTVLAPLSEEESQKQTQEVALLEEKLNILNAQASSDTDVTHKVKAGELSTQQITEQLIQDVASATTGNTPLSLQSKQDLQMLMLKNAMLQQAALQAEQERAQLKKEQDALLVNKQKESTSNDIEKSGLSSSQIDAVASATATGSSEVIIIPPPSNTGATIIAGAIAANSTQAAEVIEPSITHSKSSFDTSKPMDYSKSLELIKAQQKKIDDLQYQLLQPTSARTIPVQNSGVASAQSPIPTATGTSALSTNTSVNTNINNDNVLTKPPKQREPKTAATLSLAQSAPIESEALTSEPTDEARLKVDLSDLKKAPRNSYSIQLGAMTSLTGAMSFINEHQLSDAKVYKANRKDGLRYIIIYGQYKSLVDASNAIKKLPENLKTQSPWPKSYRSINLELREN